MLILKRKDASATKTYSTIVATLLSDSDDMQLASEEWHACAQNRLQMAGIPWQGHWTFVRADCNPDLYWWMHPDHGVASLIRESTSGQVY
jgi:hypothetical protein